MPLEKRISPTSRARLPLFCLATLAGIGAGADAVNAETPPVAEPPAVVSNASPAPAAPPQAAPDNAAPQAPAPVAAPGQPGAHAGDQTGTQPGGQPAAQKQEAPAAGAPSGPPPAAAPPSRPAPRNYYVEPRSYGTRRDPEPPRYSRTLSKTGIPAFKDLDWLDFGLEQRTRYEYRDQDLRRPIGIVDQPLLFRTRAYLGIHDKLDPFRFGIEVQDSRRYNSAFPIDDRDWNQTDLVQGFAELYFKDALGEGRPLRLQGGRMAFEYMDRRLIARNDWRNTTGNFEGFRAILGQESSDWQLDLLALNPVRILPTEFDEGDHTRRFFGAIGNLRRWSDVITLQPYYLVLDQDETADQARRTIHTTALRGYGIVGDSGFDYDFDVAFQFGKDAGRTHRAFGLTTEVGYTWDHAWRPRLAGFFGYATGDRDPTDNVSQRFDRLFGFRRPWSANDYFGWDNIIAPKLRVDARPTKRLRFDAGYSPFWLASAKDSWKDGPRQDPTGRSGSFIGHEFDLRLRYAFSHADVTFGYAHFIPGEFTRNTGRGDRTNFFYLEVSARIFK